MAVGKDHEEKKKRAYQDKRTKSTDWLFADVATLDEDSRNNLISLHRDKGLPVEGYKPLFKELHKQHPIEKRY
jgi:hypothetical protein